MTPKEKGRFCSSCSKTVIDFTQKSRQEIQEYLSQNFGKRVCGHFHKKQLDTITIEIPNTTFEQPLSFQKLFILALVFVMGTTLFSCQYSDGKKQKIKNVIVIDSLQKDIESKLQKADSLQVDTISKKECRTDQNEKSFALGGIPRPPTPIPLTGIIAVDNNSAIKSATKFNLDSIVEVDELTGELPEIPPVVIEGLLK